MNTKNKKNSLPSLESIWADSGARELRFKGNGFRSFLAPYCHYSLSSHVFGDVSFNEKKLRALESHLSNEKWKDRYLSIEGKVDQNFWKAHGYQILEYQVCHLWKPKILLPPNYDLRFEVHSFETKQGQELYNQTAGKVFGVDSVFTKRWLKLNKLISHHILLIVIKNSKNKPMAIAGLSCIKKNGFIHSVAVLPQFQGRGLLSHLMNFTQKTGEGHGCTHFVCTSRNPKMLSMMDALTPFNHIFKRKDQA
jgi:hypothetical protein